jgi:adenine-specific DNA-methyltransferase
VRELRNLPIKKIAQENQQPFINKVNEILSLKSEDPKADTNDLEQEIDIMVYELYGLTEEEIKIVEES